MNDFFPHKSFVNCIDENSVEEKKEVFSPKSRKINKTMKIDDF